MNEIKRIFRAFKYSCDGFTAAWRSEAAFRLEIIIFIVGFVAAILLPGGMLARAALISSLVLILLAELANTAIETIINRISDEIHPLSKKAKDIGSLMVLTSFIGAGIVWGLVLLDFFGLGW